MRDMHVWNLLASHVPNALPRSVPWLRLHNWHISVAHSQWPRHAGRLIWASLLLLVGIVVAFVLVRRPKPAEPATWAQTRAIPPARRIIRPCAISPTQPQVRRTT